MKVEMSAKAISVRLKRVSQLRRLCLTLAKARPVRVEESKGVGDSTVLRSENIRSRLTRHPGPGEDRNRRSRARIEPLTHDRGQSPQPSLLAYRMPSLKE